MGSATYFGESHLEFQRIPLEKGRKMYKYDVVNTKFEDKIGVIHWRGGWRQYVFQSDRGVDMSRSCQKEIIKFTDKLMKEWKIKLDANRDK